MTSLRPQTGPASPLGALLREQRESLLCRWTRRVLEDPMVPAANRLTEPALRNHIAELLDVMSAALDACDQRRIDGDREGRAAGRAWLTREHAQERFFSAYTLDEALRELSHLRATITDLCQEAQIVPPTKRRSSSTPPSTRPWPSWPWRSKRLPAPSWRSSESACAR
ncbi:Hypothetical protein A7982_04136 [Minicystis rosea]|nr:Hypothetical protein A7982_04136 [Minicystis rosea]